MEPYRFNLQLLGKFGIEHYMGKNDGHKNY
jgi:hypothetical protein